MGVSLGCNNLGVLYRQGFGVKQDIQKAIDLFNKACSSNYMMACTNLGDMYRAGTGVSYDFEKAVKLYEKACNNSEMTGCNALTDIGNMYYTGKGVQRDIGKAVEFYEKACDGNDWQTCEHLVTIYNFDAVPPKYANAFAILERACGANQPRGCILLAEEYYSSKTKEGHEA